MSLLKIIILVFIFHISLIRADDDLNEGTKMLLDSNPKIHQVNELKNQVDKLMEDIKLYEGGINNRTKIYYLNSGKMMIFETQRTSTPGYIWEILREIQHKGRDTYYCYLSNVTDKIKMVFKSISNCLTPNGEFLIRVQSQIKSISEEAEKIIVKLDDALECASGEITSECDLDKHILNAGQSIKDLELTVKSVENKTVLDSMNKCYNSALQRLKKVYSNEKYHECLLHVLHESK